MGMRKFRSFIQDRQRPPSNYAERSNLKEDTQRRYCGCSDCDHWE